MKSEETTTNETLLASHSHPAPASRRESSAADGPSVLPRILAIQILNSFIIRLTLIHLLIYHTMPYGIIGGGGASAVVCCHVLCPFSFASHIELIRTENKNIHRMNVE